MEEILAGMTVRFIGHEWGEIVGKETFWGVGKTPHNSGALEKPTVTVIMSNRTKYDVEDPTETTIFWRRDHEHLYTSQPYVRFGNIIQLCGRKNSC